MPFVERTYSSTQPLRDATKSAANPPIAGEADIGHGIRRDELSPPAAARPRTPFGHFVRLTRANAALALVIPLLSGTTLGWWEGGHFRTAAFFTLFVSALTAFMGVNLLHDFFDFKRSFASNKISESRPYFDAYGMIMYRRIKAIEVRQLGRIFLLFSLISSVMAAILEGWPLLIFTGFSLCLVLTYSIPPISYGWRGWGIGETGLLIGYGILQVLAGYYAQTQSVTMLALWVSIPFGLFALLVTLNHNLVYQRRDWLNRKRTLPVQLGLERGVDASTAIVTLGYIGIILVAALARLPLWTLSSLATLPMALGAFGRLRREFVTMDDFIHLYYSSIRAIVVTGLLFSLALWADRIM